MPEYITIEEFARRIKTKYPAYKDMEDAELTKKVLSRYQGYKENISPEDIKSLGLNPAINYIEDVKKKEEDIVSPSVGGDLNAPLPQVERPAQKPLLTSDINFDLRSIDFNKKPEEKLGKDLWQTLKASAAQAGAAFYGAQGLLEATLFEGVEVPIRRALGDSEEEIEAIRETYMSPKAVIGEQIQMAAHAYAGKAVENLKQYEQGIVKSIGDKDYEAATRQLLRGVVGSLPYLTMVAATAGGGTPATLATIGTVASAQRYGELKATDKMDDKKLKQVANAWMYGGFEAAGELVTMGILNNFKRALSGAGNEVIAKESQKIAKTLLKEIFGEAGSESATELGQQITDYISGERNSLDLAQVVDAGIIGLTSVAPISATTAMTNAATGKRVASTKDIETIQSNQEQIMDLNIESDRAASEGVKKSIESEIENLEQKNNEIYDKNIEIAKSLSKDQLQRVSDLDHAIGIYQQRIADKKLTDQDYSLEEQILNKLEQDKADVITEATKKTEVAEPESTKEKQAPERVIQKDEGESGTQVSPEKVSAQLEAEITEVEQKKEVARGEELLQTKESMRKELLDKGYTSERAEEMLNMFDQFTEKYIYTPEEFAKTKEGGKEYAEEIGKEVKKTGEQAQELVEGEEERLRVRDTEKDRLEAEQGKEEVDQSLDEKIALNKKIEEEYQTVVKTSQGAISLDSAGTTPINVAKKYMKKEGLLPREVFDKYVKTMGTIRGEVQKIDFLNKDFKRALRKAYGKTIIGTPKISNEILGNINSVLERIGTEPQNRHAILSELPEGVRDVVSDMRNHIDALSSALARSGLVSGDLKGKIEQNLGYYLTRTYRKFNDRGWKWENIPSEIKIKAAKYVTDVNPNMTFEEVDGLLKSLVNDNDINWGFVKEGKLGAKDLGILKKRKEIAEPIRQLFGEYKDPFYNYATSVMKLSSLVNKHAFLEDVRSMGMNNWLFDKPTGDYSVQLASKGSKTFEPLNGLYTTKEIAEAFTKFNEIKAFDGWLRLYMKANSFTKYSKTILSPITHTRNFLSNFSLQIVNGRIAPVAAAKTAQNYFNFIRKANDQEMRDYFVKLNSYGIIGESTRVNELRDNLRESMKYFDDFEKYGDNFFKKAFNKGRKFVEGAYAMEDDIHKVYAFEVEKDRYKDVFKKQNPDKTDDEIIKMAEDKAAEVVRYTMPTYSEVPKLIKDLRRFPLTGAFVSFPAEILRTTYNTVDLAIKDLKEPATRTIGAKRLAGFATAATMTATISALSRMRAGMSGDDEDDFRRFLAPWSKNSDIIVVKDLGNGKYTYTDLGFSDPHNYIKVPVNALLKGNVSDDSVLDAIRELFSPFLGEEILAGRLVDVSRNKRKDSTKEIYNEEDPIGTQVMDKMAYVLEGIEPGVISSSRRIRDAFKNKVNDYGGGGGNPYNELLNVVIGQKIQTLDVGQSYKYRLAETGERLDNAVDIYKFAKYKTGATQNDIDDAYERASKAINEVMMDASGDYQAALNLGVRSKVLDDFIDRFYVGDYPANKKVKRAIRNGYELILNPDDGKLYIK